MSRGLYHIIYQSYSFGVPTTAALRHLLKQSRTNNIQLGLTGLLLYGNENYLQVLEGEQVAVNQVYEAIRNDHRHFGVETISSGPIKIRVFQEWSMGFQKLSEADFNRLTGYIDPCRARLLDAHLPSIDHGVRILLKSFVQNTGPQL